MLTVAAGSTGIGASLSTMARAGVAGTTAAGDVTAAGDDAITLLLGEDFESAERFPSMNAAIQPNTSAHPIATTIGRPLRRLPDATTSGGCPLESGVGAGSADRGGLKTDVGGSFSIGTAASLLVADSAANRAADDGDPVGRDCTESGTGSNVEPAGGGAGAIRGERQLLQKREPASLSAEQIGQSFIPYDNDPRRRIARQWRGYWLCKADLAVCQDRHS